MNRDAVQACYETIQVHSKSFAMASRLFSPEVRDRAVVVYAWCRHADDAVDKASGDAMHKALQRLQGELEEIYSGAELTDPMLAAFQETVQTCHIHSSYPADLLAGMALDVDDTRYDTMDQLLYYCYCVAGTVGLMMCHVMGVKDEDATKNAVHMGMAMQLTNICRDVLEDWHLGRLYIPEEVLQEFGCTGLASRLGKPIEPADRAALAKATKYLLDEADRYYASGDVGLPALSWRCALAVRSARRIYSAIGTRVERVGCDPSAGRAIVPKSDKIGHVTASLLMALRELRRRMLSNRAVATPRRRVVFPSDVLPIQEPR